MHVFAQCLSSDLLADVLVCVLSAAGVLLPLYSGYAFYCRFYGI